MHRKSLQSVCSYGSVLRDSGHHTSPLSHYLRTTLIKTPQRRARSTSIDTYQLSIPQLHEDSDHYSKVKKLTSSGLPIIHHHGYVSDLPPRHRFAMRKFHGVMKFLRKDNVISMKQVVMPGPLSEDLARLAHTEDYVHRFYRGLTTLKEQRRTGFVWNEGLLRRCRLEAGGTVEGALLALERGLACSTGGGTHHASWDSGSGFCLLNDLAIAARYVIKRGAASRVLIVDLDVHQGDGTAVILADEEHAFTFSMHCQSNFPFHKAQSDLDLGVADHLEDAEYLRQLKERLPSLLESFRPDLVLYDAGVDPHVKDELGKLDLTDQGLYRRDLYVLQTCLQRGVPVMSVIGGGYSRDLNELSLRHTILHRAATKVWCEKKP